MNVIAHGSLNFAISCIFIEFPLSLLTMNDVCAFAPSVAPSIEMAMSLIVIIIFFIFLLYLFLFIFQLIEYPAVYDYQSEEYDGYSQEFFD